jgi:signal transduction histidine kinase/CheY-like chemotaxis protein
MRNNKASKLIILAFILGFITLILLRIYAIANMNDLLQGNEKLSYELRAGNYLRTVDHNLLSIENRIRATIATNDTSHLSGIDEKSNELRRYLDSLKGGNIDPNYQKDLNQLAKRANDKLVVAHQLEYLFQKTGKLNDTSFIANPRARMVADEITAITNNIYDRRQLVMTRLSSQISENGRIAQQVGNVFLVMVLISSCLLCWYIITQLNKQHRLIAQLDISERKAQDALKIKENFLANMSHEIRTPLNSILGFTNLLRKQELNKVSQEFVHSIQGAGENLLAIINDILDLSKIEAGMMRIVNQPFSIRGLMHSIETLFSQKLSEKRLIFSYEVDPEVPDTLLGDATRLTQILVNLIGNAIKFSEQGKITIHVYSNRQENTKALQLAFTVKDNGIGIEKEKLNLIFDRFNQAEEYITRNYGGTGLGLSIVKNLVVLQQGTISVKSEPGKGTEFSFTLPYTIADDQIAHIDQQNQETFKEYINPLLEILVVDDNTMNQSLIKHLLMQWNASFDIVSNGIEAIDQLKLKKYTLILMDIQMPKMDGYAATDFIRRELKLELPIIAMTAHAMAGEREKCISYGMNEYIAKPINEDDLFKIISRFIEPKPYVEVPSQVTADSYQFIDLTYMKDISKGNRVYEKKVTGQFISFIPEDLIAIHEAYQQQDFKKINSVAHNMKTSVSIMGLLPLLKPCLDTLEFSQTDSVDVVAAIAKLDGICKNAVTESRHLFEGMDSI